MRETKEQELFPFLMHVRNKGRKITMNFQVPAPYLAWPRLSKTLCVEIGLTRTFFETRETKAEKSR